MEREEIIIYSIGISSKIYQNSKEYKTKKRKESIIYVFDWIYNHFKWTIRVLDFLGVKKVFQKLFDRAIK